jgi:hypothetical protein
MQTKHASRIFPLAGACLLAAMTAQASIIDYSATGVIQQVDNASTLPGVLNSAVVGQSFTFNFSVDTATPGSGVFGDSTYFSALLSASYELDGNSSPFSFGSNAVEVLNNSGGVTGYVVSAGDPVDADFSGTAGAVSILTLAYSGVPLNLYSDTSLSNAPLSSGNSNLQDNVTLSFTEYLHGVAESISDIFVGPTSIKQSGGPLLAPEIDPNSAVAGLTLLIGSLLVLGGRRRKRLE